MSGTTIATGSSTKWIVWPLDNGCEHEHKYPLYCASWDKPGHEDHIVGWGCHGDLDREDLMDDGCNLFAHWEGPGAHWCTGPGDMWGDP